MTENDEATKSLSWQERLRNIAEKLQQFIIKITPIIKRFSTTIPWASVVFSAILVPFYLVDTIITTWEATKEKEDAEAKKKSRIKAAGNLFLLFLGNAILFSSLVFGAIALVVATTATLPIITLIGAALVVAGACKTIVENLWAIGFTLYSRIFGRGNRDKHEIKAIERKINCYKAAVETEKNFENHIVSSQDEEMLKKRQANTQEMKWLKPTEQDFERLAELKKRQAARNVKLLENTHYVIQGIIAFIGAVLVCNPVTLPVGLAIVAGISAYGIADVTRRNPLRWIGKGINKLVNFIFGKPLVNVDTNVTAEKLRAKMGVPNIANKPKASEPVHAKIELTLATTHASSNTDEKSRENVQEPAPALPTPTPNPNAGKVSRHSFIVISNHRVEKKATTKEETTGEGEHPPTAANHH